MIFLLLAEGVREANAHVYHLVIIIIMHTHILYSQLILRIKFLRLTDSFVLIIIIMVSIVVYFVPLMVRDYHEYVTGFAKTRHNHAKTEIQFIA